MTSAITQRPLCVTESTVGPYLILPLSQLEEVQRLFDAKGIRYRVGEHAVSWNGAPETIDINFGRGVDAAAVQAILDSAG